MTHTFGEAEKLDKKLIRTGNPGKQIKLKQKHGITSDVLFFIQAIITPLQLIDNSNYIIK